MCNTISKKETYTDRYYIKNNICLAHKEKSSNNTCISKYSFDAFADSEYYIVLNGTIYNLKEIKKDLQENNFIFKSNNDIEIILKGFIHYGYDIVTKLNGSFSFAIWNSKSEELFIARDHFGIKPLFYTIFDDSFVFATEIKTLFNYPGIEKIIDSQCIGELFGIGPCHSPGLTVFKNIFELKPAHFAIYNKSGFHIERYWQLESKEHKDSFEITCDKVKTLLEDSINKQLISDTPVSTFLSGGLDSSIITAFASNYIKNHELKPLNTFSVDYIDNDKNFIKSDFQPNSDNYYINLMVDKFHTNHINIVLDTPELADSLEDAMIARDMPGMADVDSSLLLFCKNVKPYSNIGLTGECADEIFGGYPWFFRDDALSSNTFPWSLAISERQELLHPDISKRINLKDYIDYRYHESINKINILDTDSKETAEKRKISYLTLNWFMQTLLDRSDRAASYNDFEIRVPFCDYRLAEYLWNIPWELKALNNREKGLLRYVMRNILPKEIIDRKKSPYPKTHNPNYLSKVKSMLTDIIENNGPINNLLNKEFILNVLETDGKSFSRPWFGQLMTGPQFMAYLCQVNMWLEKYQPKIEI